MSVIKDLGDLDLALWSGIVRLYMRDPLTHVYLLYDLVYELESTDAYFLTPGGEVAGYVLIWHGPEVDAIHLWGESLEQLSLIKLGRPSIITVHEENLLAPVLEMVREMVSEYRVLHFYTMAVSEEGFKPAQSPEGVEVKRLSEAELGDFIELNASRGRTMSTEKARSVLRKRRYYGAYIDETLASMACTYLRTNEVAVVGDVYTRPEFRGRGLARAVTTAVTRDITASGAVAMLHVAEENTPAIRAYEALGYKAVNRRPWIFAML